MYSGYNNKKNCNTKISNTLIYVPFEKVKYQLHVLYILSNSSILSKLQYVLYHTEQLQIELHI